MKKILLMMFLVLPAVFVGCSDDDKDYPDSLAGTTWVGTMKMGNETITDTLKFLNETNVEMTYSSVFPKDKATYVYNPPKVILTDIQNVNTNVDTIIINGTVSGNTLKIELGTIPVTLTRK